MEKRDPPWTLIGGLCFLFIKKKSTAVCKKGEESKKTNCQLDFFGVVIWMFNLFLEASFFLVAKS